jgi:4-amino-4-deoxy-L-arabinose transferase-like glycosyltransferase
MRRAWLTIALGIVLVGGLLRFWALGTAPVALYCDEAFQGYEALSLLMTGADSRGAPTPLFFDVFGVGWEEPLYIYLTTIPVALLGTTEAAVRAVAASAGTLALPAVAWLALGLRGRAAALAACALMAISPWAFHFSRIGFQASLLPLLLATGGAGLLHGVQGKRDAGAAQAAPEEKETCRPSLPWLAFGMLLMALALYAYVAARVLVPLLILGWAGLFFPALRRLGPARTTVLTVLLLLAALPVALFSVSSAGLARYEDVGLLSRYGGPEAAWRFVGNYASYLSPAFLLTEGDPNPRHSVPGFGVLHAHGLLFLVVGIVAALARRRPGDLFLLWWLAAAPVPAALAADPAHAVRSIGALPAIYALAGSGAATLFSRRGPLSPLRLRGASLLGIVILAGAASSALYLYHYFAVYPMNSAPAWQFGLKETYREVESRAPSHDSIYVTRLEDFPYIHRLYLFGFPPEEFQRHGFSRTKYLFNEPVFYGGGIVPGRKRPLFIMKPQEVPERGLTGRRVIPYPDGSAAFVVAW